MIDMVGSVQPHEKIVSVADLHGLRERFRHLRIVQCHGAFDLVHIGHLVHFEEARSLGDLLVVTITADHHITKKRTITFNEDQRARQVAALQLVDYVAVVHEPSALSAIAALHPDVYVKGPEYADLMLDKSRSIFHEVRVLESYGGRIHFTSGETFSSTKISHFLLAAPEAAQRNPLLRNERVLFKDVSQLGFALNQLKYFLARAASLNVCVIGETITDEWVDVALTNLSTQSRCLAGRETGRIRQVGGAGIITHHLAAFARSVECCTNGSPASLAANVRVTSLVPGEVVETRFVDEDSGRPLFKSRHTTITPCVDCSIPDFDQYDLVLIADFGHGLLDVATVNRRLAGRRRASVAVMAQVNSSNYGYNLPIKYDGANYYCLNRVEAELCVQTRGLPLEELASRAARRLECSMISVTDGGAGAVVLSDGVHYAIPSLSISVVDAIGCGDAYFALSSLAATLALPPELVALVGSIGAAAMTQRRCNASAVTEQEFMTIGKIVI